MQLADRILVMTYRPGRVKRMVDIELPRPRTSEIVSSEAFGRYVAQIWSDLREEASRGMRRRPRDRALHEPGSMAHDRRGAGTQPAGCRRCSGSARSCWSIAAVEVLIRAGADQPLHRPPAVGNRDGFGRVITEEDIAERFRLTFLEAFTAGVMITVVGVAIGFLLLPRRPVAAGDRNLGGGPRVGADRADVSAVPW